MSVTPMEKLVALAKEVARERTDAAEWKDDAPKLRRMAEEALSAVVVKFTPEERLKQVQEAARKGFSGE